MLIGAFAVSKVVNNTSQQQSMIAQNAVLAEQESAREKETQALHA